MGTSVVVNVMVVVSVISPSVVAEVTSGKLNVSVEVTKTGVPDSCKNVE